MKKLITILILISIISLSALFFSSSPRHKIANIKDMYETADGHIEDNSKQAYGV